METSHFNSESPFILHRMLLSTISLCIRWTWGVWDHHLQDTAADLDASSFIVILSEVHVERFHFHKFFFERNHSWRKKTRSDARRLIFSPLVFGFSVKWISEGCVQPKCISLHICLQLSGERKLVFNDTLLTHTKPRRSSSELGQQGCFEFQSDFLGAQI